MIIESRTLTHYARLWKLRAARTPATAARVPSTTRVSCGYSW